MSKIKLSTQRLAIGLYIQLPCSWNEHPFVFNHFKIETAEQIKALQNITINHVLYFPEKSDNLPLVASALTEKNQPRTQRTKNRYLDKLWQKKRDCIERQEHYLRVIKKREREFQQALATVRAIHLKLVDHPQQAFTDATELTKQLIDKLGKVKDSATVLHLLKEKKEHDKYHCHLFHVAILAIMLGQLLKLPKPQQIYLGLGALFHDIGKTKVPQKILNNRPKVSVTENNYYKMHVRYALEKISEIDEFPEVVSEIISQHHEYLDGSGYPKKLCAEQINQLTQIVSIANEYDNLCYPSDKHVAHTPHQVLSHLYKNRNKQLNKEVLGLLIKEFGIYPPGSIVKLSNGSYALVISTNNDNILQPNVIIYDPSIPKNNTAIICLSEHELKIESALMPADLPEQAREYLNPHAKVSYYLGGEDVIDEHS